MKRIRSELIPLERLETWDTAETLLPEYTPRQYQDLEEFIAGGGQLAPITVSEDYRIIDGYNRWRTAQRLSFDAIECDIYSYADQAEMELHAIVLNSKRRHLNRLQVARAAARLAELFGIDDAQAGNPVRKEPLIPASAQSDESDQEGKEASEAPEIKPSRPDQAVRTVSHKLGILPSTVEQVSKVDKSGNERLISAMEGKTISIRQAAEIADMDDDQRSQAIEAIDVSRKKQNSLAEVFARNCDECIRKLQSSEKKLRTTEFTESERHDMKAALARMIDGANELIDILSADSSSEENESGSRPE